jgi:serine/threonine-protein kinase
MTKAKAGQDRFITSVESGARYALKELLGEGGFGSVWRCECKTHDAPLCLKLTRDQASWHREAYMAQLLGDHPHVVKVIETFPVIEPNGISYAVVMELAEHGTLADVVEREGAWAEAQAVAEISKILGAVDRLHSCGALHRDITPFNVFVCGEARAMKLGDFGITTHGPRKGVVADAFAPWFVDAAIREERRVHWDTREDLWQVAQVLAVLLTGEVKPLRLADVRTIPCSTATRAIIARATGERSGRFDSARALIDALKDSARVARAPEAARPGPAKRARPRTLQGRHLVFTGKLSIPRKEAVALAEACGAVVGKDFTSETDLIVIGDSKLWAAGDAGGKKLLAAQAQREDGRRIDEISEPWFLKLVGKIPRGTEG